MEQLPIEILNKIFLLLHQVDKVECQLVCHHWNIIIRSFSLWSTIRFTKMSSLKKFLDNVQSEIIWRTQTERLILDLYIEEDFDLSSIHECFPNLRVLFLHKAGNNHFQKKVRTLLQRSNIECITELFSHTLTLEILTSNSCLLLKTLSVTATDAKLSGKLIISLLTNAPHLSSICMSQFSISLDDLELLHITATSLKSVNFDNIYLLDNLPPTYIDPATSVTSFTLIVDSAKPETQSKWLNYVKRKYIKLEKIGFCIGESESDQYPGIDRQDFISLIQGLGSRLTTFNTILGTEEEHDPNIFDMLDNSACQIQDLSLVIRTSQLFFERFSRSSQTKYIRKLQIIALDCQSFEWLKDLEALKGFSFCFASQNTFKKKNIQLDKLIDMCPSTLKSLTIMNAELDISSLSACKPTIQILKFAYCILPEHIDHFISSSFQGLHELALLYCKFNNNKIWMIDIHLDSIEVTDENITIGDYLLVVTNKEQRLYHCEQRLIRYAALKDHFGIYDIPVNQYVKPVVINNTQTYPAHKAALICKSVKTVFFLGH